MRARIRLLVILMLVMTAAVFPVRGESTTPPTEATAEIEHALTGFLTAFENLDWPVFRECFAPDATMFHPALPNGKRIDSQQEFERAWMGVFARIKKSSGKDSPPYMKLAPQDLRIQFLAEDVALVTFHLVDGTTLSRRSFIFRRSPDGWKIVHLHASNLTMAPP